jgi:hypothetical protein
VSGFEIIYSIICSPCSFAIEGVCVVDPKEWTESQENRRLESEQGCKAPKVSTSQKWKLSLGFQQQQQKHSA